MKKTDINKIIKYMAQTERDEGIKITDTDIMCDMNYDDPENCGEGVFLVYFGYESKHKKQKETDEIDEEA